MKIQLDTDRKTIKLEDNVLLSKLVETLNKLLPNKEWKKFTLETHTTITHWHEPIVVEKWHEPVYPWYQPNYYSTIGDSILVKGYKATETSAMQLNSGVYNVEA